MQRALDMFGVKLSKKEVDQLISEATLSETRTVSYDAFKRVMLASHT